jgi:hypothetical protein
VPSNALLISQCTECCNTTFHPVLIVTVLHLHVGLRYEWTSKANGLVRGHLCFSIYRIQISYRYIKTAAFPVIIATNSSFVCNNIKCSLGFTPKLPQARVRSLWSDQSCSTPLFSRGSCKQDSDRCPFGGSFCAAPVSCEWWAWARTIPSAEGQQSREYPYSIERPPKTSLYCVEQTNERGGLICEQTRVITGWRWIYHLVCCFQTENK